VKPRPSEISVAKIKEYRQQIHSENEQIRHAAEAGRPLRDARTGQGLRTLSNASINQTLRTLALILDDAEDAEWIERNPARAKRTREPAERGQHPGVLNVDEFLDLLEAATQIDRLHRPQTLEKASIIRGLRDAARLDWKAIGRRIGVAPTTAMYLYGCAESQTDPSWSPRRAVIATLGLASLRIGEFCQLGNRDINLSHAQLHIGNAKTAAGVRTLDIHPRLLDELGAYRAGQADIRDEAPAFLTRWGTR
jgi:integrase